MPAISRLLKKEGNLDLLYFLVEGPMQKQLQGIKEGLKAPIFFEKTALQVYAK